VRKKKLIKKIANPPRGKDVNYQQRRGRGFSAAERESIRKNESHLRNERQEKKTRGHFWNRYQEEDRPEEESKRAVQGSVSPLTCWKPNRGKNTIKPLPYAVPCLEELSLEGKKAEKQKFLDVLALKWKLDERSKRIWTG